MVPLYCKSRAGDMVIFPLATSGIPLLDSTVLSCPGGAPQSFLIACTGIKRNYFPFSCLLHPQLSFCVFPSPAFFPHSLLPIGLPLELLFSYFGRFSFVFSFLPLVFLHFIFSCFQAQCQILLLSHTSSSPSPQHLCCGRRIF